MNDKKINENDNTITSSITNFMDIACKNEVERYKENFDITPQKWESFINFKMKADDIIVSTYPKTGTTLALHICHLLRGGDMNFKEQHLITPFMEYIWNYGDDYSKVSGLTDFKQRILKFHSPIS